MRRLTKALRPRMELSNNHHLERLPAYSPFLNPIENVFSVMKGTTKQHLAANQHRPDERVATAHAGATLADWRRDILLDGIALSVQTVTGELVDTEYRHSNVFLPACAAREDVTA